MTNRQLAIGNRQLLCWQGWRVELPARWNPVRIDGDACQGSVLIADLHRPRLGLRWTTPPRRRFDPQKWVRQTLLSEIGQLATDEARAFEMPGGEWSASTLYIEPEPPGRDLWVAFSPVSKRCILVVHHAHRRENLLAGSVLPTLQDLGTDDAMRWAVFDLSCESPAGMKLVSHRLNAGDLSLSFESPRQVLRIRQIALAQMALKRMPMEKWLADQQKQRGKHFRAIGKAAEIVLDERKLAGLSRKMVRRRRFVFMRSLPRELITAVVHDVERERLILVESSDRAMLESAAGSVGWAS